LSSDKYGDGQDPYCYPGTSVLKNRFDLRNDEDLREVELYISAKASEQLEFQSPPYSLDNLKVIHRTLFSDLYSWAGKIRTVKISKGGTQFCVPERIEPEASKIFAFMASASWFESRSRTALINSIAESYGIEKGTVGSAYSVRMAHCEYRLRNQLVGRRTGRMDRSQHHFILWR